MVEPQAVGTRKPKWGVCGWGGGGRGAGVVCRVESLATRVGPVLFKDPGVAVKSRKSVTK